MESAKDFYKQYQDLEASQGLSVEDKKAKFERYSSLDGGEFHQLAHINSIVDENPVLINWGVFGV